jgi:hypothetical protein
MKKIFGSKKKGPVAPTVEAPTLSDTSGKVYF